MGDAARLIMITNPILKHGIKLDDMYRINNLSVLLMLAKNNFASGNRVFQMCMQAEELVHLQDQEEDNKVGDNDETSAKFLRQLCTTVLWAKEDVFDKEVETVLTQTELARQR